MYLPFHIHREANGDEDITFFAKLDPQKKCLSVYHAQKVSQESLALRNVDMFFESQVNSEPGAVRNGIFISLFCLAFSVSHRIVQ